MSSDTISVDEALHARFGDSTVQPRPGANPADGIVAESQAMQEVVSLIDRAARRDTAVLLVGESGTGKELLSRAIHRKSPRSNGPFVAVNCSAIPDTLLESELFGHRRGAFTDAREDQPGLFQSANRGTLFLDEIGDMAPALQAKLLRVLQEREVQPLGASAPVAVDVRVVTATHRDLDERVRQERFRQDLLYRINVVEVWVPPLRDRLDDLAPLVAHLLDKLGARLELSGCTVSADAMTAFTRYPWPGNIRELENVIERALVLGSGVTIGLEDLPDRLTRRPASMARSSAGRRLIDVERDHIRRTLETVGGNKAAAARALDVNRKTLYRKLRQHRLAML
jgi:transcriptional regulator with PAS, ATPase and Fis domain